VQIGLVPISEKHLEYAEQVKKKLEAAGLRVELDARNEKMNAKIREFTLQKVPFVLIMGDKESTSEAVSVRTRGKGDEGSVSLADFITRATALANSRGVDL
jgi:threonyl-tRNA synthetase